MGQAKRRKQQLGHLYGTTKGSNSQTVQSRLDQVTLKHIQAQMTEGCHVVLIGTESARPLAAAAGLPWLHELPEGDPVPKSVAWDPAIAEAGGPLLPPHASDDGLLILGGGCFKWLESCLLGIGCESNA